MTMIDTLHDGHYNNREKLAVMVGAIALATNNS